MAEGRRVRAAVFQPEFREDLRHWVETDRRVALRALDLVEALRDPFVGIGEAEPPKEPAPGGRGGGPTPGHRLGPGRFQVLDPEALRQAAQSVDSSRTPL